MIWAITAPMTTPAKKATVPPNVANKIYPNPIPTAPDTTVRMMI